MCVSHSTPEVLIEAPAFIDGLIDKLRGGHRYGLWMEDTEYVVRLQHDGASIRVCVRVCLFVCVCCYVVSGSCGACFSLRCWRGV